MDQILDYATPKAKRNLHPVPAQAWLSIAFALSSPVVALILDNAGIHYIYVWWLPRTISGGFHFALLHTAYLSLPVAAVVFGFSGAVRSIARQNAFGCVIGAIGFVLGVIAYLFMLPSFGIA